MKTNEFNSVFASLIVDFIEYKRAAGYKYVSRVFRLSLSYVFKVHRDICIISQSVQVQG